MSTANYSLTVSSYDYQILLEIIERYPSPAAQALDEELDRAEVVKTADFPRDIVAMNSAVTFVDLDSCEQNTISLVYPQEADVDKMKISILSPVGTALIGLRIGDKIDWPLPNGRVRRLQVISLVSPEK